MDEMDGYLLKQIGDAYKKDHRLDALTNTALRENLGAQAELVAQLRQTQIQQANEIDRLKRRNAELERGSAADDHRTRRALAKQSNMLREQIAAWAVSQKAFKELAIRFGAGLGMTCDDIHAQGNALKWDVIESMHDPAHGTNANRLSEVYAPWVAKQRRKILSDREFPEEYASLIAAGTLYDFGISTTDGWSGAAAAWHGLEQAGDCRARYNLAWCYLKDKLDEGETPYRTRELFESALSAGEPRSAQFLYEIIGPDPYRNDSVYAQPDNLQRDRCLEFGLARGDAWARQAQQEIADEAERKHNEKLAREFENARFAEARVIHAGAYAHWNLLQEMEHSDYRWVAPLSLLVRCRMSIQFENIRKAGGVFSLAKVGDAYFRVENVTDSTVSIAINGKNNLVDIPPGKTAKWKVATAVKAGVNPTRLPDRKLAAINVHLAGIDQELAVYVPDTLIS
jgi:hypothetical protein